MGWSVFKRWYLLVNPLAPFSRELGGQFLILSLDTCWVMPETCGAPPVPDTMQSAERILTPVMVAHERCEGGVVSVLNIQVMKLRLGRERVK